jgi:hypothetical protein
MLAGSEPRIAVGCLNGHFVDFPGVVSLGFIVSVIVRVLAENPNVRVTLIEAVFLDPESLTGWGERATTIISVPRAIQVVDGLGALDRIPVTTRSVLPWVALRHGSGVFAWRSVFVKALQVTVRVIVFGGWRVGVLLQALRDSVVWVDLVEKPHGIPQVFVWLICESVPKNGLAKVPPIVKDVLCLLALQLRV